MIRFHPMPIDHATAYRQGALDAHGLPPERHVSDGAGNPCRHGLRMILQGAGMLILAYRPFATLHPYAEVGPVFLCADACAAFDGDSVPDVFTNSPDYLLKGHGADERFIYGTGSITPAAAIPARAQALLADPRATTAGRRGSGGRDRRCGTASCGNAAFAVIRRVIPAERAHDPEFAQ